MAPLLTCSLDCHRVQAARTARSMIETFRLCYNRPCIAHVLIWSFSRALQNLAYAWLSLHACWGTLCEDKGFHAGKAENYPMQPIIFVYVS